MAEHSIYRDIAERTGGDIYIGVVEAASSSLVTQTNFLWKRNKNRVEIVWFQPCFCAF